MVVRQLVDEFRQIVELEVHVENGDDIALRVANRLGERHDETVREAREEQVGPIGFARVDDVAEPFLLLEINVEEGAEQPFVAALRMDLHDLLAVAVRDGDELDGRFVADGLADEFLHDLRIERENFLRVADLGGQILADFDGGECVCGFTRL